VTMNSKQRLSISLSLVISLTACQTAFGSSATKAPGSSTAGGPAQSASAAPESTSAPAAETSLPAVAGLPPQTAAAEIRPPERRPELSRLTNLLHFQVTGLNNTTLGKVSDFIVNACETYVVYFTLDPAPELKVATSQRLVIPFEAVTINSGALDAASKSIVLHLVPSQLAAAPAFPEPLALLPNNWEQPVRNYWQRVVRVGKLSSTCAAGGGPPIFKTVYATQLLGAELKDGNQALLGTVTEAILAPESGKLAFYVVNLQNNQGLTLLPLSKTNIPDDALKPGAKIELVLLASDNQLAGAPRLANADAATDDGAQGAARQYWGR
jgi:sporulation protein YlmC with PRC-barrel domain